MTEDFIRIELGVRRVRTAQEASARQQTTVAGVLPGRLLSRRDVLLTALATGAHCATGLRPTRAADKAQDGSSLYVHRFTGIVRGCDFASFIPSETQIEYRTDLGLYRIDRETKAAHQLVVPHHLAPQSSALSPDCRYLLFGSHPFVPVMRRVRSREEYDAQVKILPRSKIHIRDLVSGREVSHTTDSLAILDTVWSPDGRHFAVRSELHPYVRRAPTDATVRLFRVTMKDGDSLMEPLGQIANTRHLPAFSPNGDQIAVSDIEEGGIRIEEFPPNADQAGNEHAHVITIGKGKRFWDAQWSPDGNRMLLVGEPNKDEGVLNLFLSTLDKASGTYGEPVALPTQQTVGLYHGYRGTHDFPPLSFAAWSPDGSRIAYVADSGRSGPFGSPSDLYLHDFRSGTNGITRRLTYTGRLQHPVIFRHRAVRWSPDGKQVAFMQEPDGKEDRTPLRVWTITVDESEDAQSGRRTLQSDTEGFADFLFDWR